MAKVSTRTKIVWSRSFALAIMVGIAISCFSMGWISYKKTNEYLGYTSGVEFIDITWDFMIDFVDDFDLADLINALLGAGVSFLLGIIKIFRSRTGTKRR